MRRFTLLSSIAAALAVVAACADSSTDTPRGSPDAGPLDSGASKSVPVVDPPAKTDDDDDVVAGDDDDVTGDAGPTPKDAGKDAAKDSGPPPPGKFRVFVTKERFSGNLGGLDGADAKCAAAALAANLGGGTWKAWVSTTDKNAGDRIIDRSPWYLIDKTTVAFQTFAALQSPPLHRIDQNETGSTSITGSGPLNNRVWTGTNNGGVLTPGKNCSEWADDTMGKGVAGAYVETSGSSNWTRYAIQPDEACGNKWPIYCFEQ